MNKRIYLFLFLIIAISADCQAYYRSRHFISMKPRHNIAPTLDGEPSSPLSLEPSRPSKTGYKTDDMVFSNSSYSSSIRHAVDTPAKTNEKRPLNEKPVKINKKIVWIFVGALTGIFVVTALRTWFDD